MPNKVHTDTADPEGSPSDPAEQGTSAVAQRHMEQLLQKMTDGAQRDDASDDTSARHQLADPPLGSLGATTPDPVAKLMGKLLGGSIAARGELGAGAQLGNYQVERRLGAGGMGEVFAARHVGTGEQVALKTLSSTTATRLYRFKREFRALADVSHRNLIHLHELVVPEAGPTYFTMELLEGEPFVAWVRGSAPVGQLPELDRLDEGLSQLVAGVHHLHLNDCVHRDLKPSNVLVTREHRVVVLDFGLISELSGPPRGVTHDKQILGTPAYMAPEQALAERVGAPADCYAIGVMLFECLTGRIPHQGAALQQLVAKQDTTLDPGDAVPDVPSRLRSICVRLLARNPSTRPTTAELLEHFRPSRPSPVRRREVFVGRRNELASLHAALDEVDPRGGPVVVHVRGRDGDGKSTLLRRFRAELERARAVTFHGRCHQRETVPYKGIDAVVDVLSAHLRGLPAEELGKLRPTDLGALVQLFPVLDDIWEPTTPRGHAPNDVRQLGVTALRRLLRAIADTRPIVLQIDDFQWSDLDSLEFLQALVRHPSLSPVLVLLSYRNDSASAAVRALLANPVLGRSVARMVELGPLASADAKELATMLLQVHGRTDLSVRRERAESIALRSHGSPLFITRMVLGQGEPEASESDMGRVIEQQISSLDESARRLLTLVSVFGAPMPVRLALELGSPTIEATTDSLCGKGLLVCEISTDGDLDRCIDVAHDRVREAVIAGLTVRERAQLHWHIGSLLLRRQGSSLTGGEVFAIVDHLGAGMGSIDALPRARRLELAKLNQAAGRRSLDVGAWAAARHYLTSAYELSSPLHADAREGGGEHDLCVEIAFGRAQSRFMLNDPSSDALFKDLLAWSLSETDHATIARWYTWHLMLKGRFFDCTAFGLEALTHLGFGIPRRPSLLRALVVGLIGWSALWRKDLEMFRVAPDASIESPTHIIGDIAAVVMVTAGGTDIKLSAFLMGRYLQYLARLGPHESVGVALASLTYSTAMYGDINKTRRLCEFAHGIVGNRSVSSFVRNWISAILIQSWPTFRPMRAVAADGQQIYDRALETESRYLVEPIGVMLATHYCCSGHPLPKITEHLGTLVAGHDEFILPWASDIHAFVGWYVQRLIEGAAAPAPPFEQLRFKEIPWWHTVIAVMRMQLAVLLGDYDGAYDMSLGLGDDSRRAVSLWYAPAHAMFSVVTDAERWSNCDVRERRLIRKRIRGHKATMRRLASWCDENYQPMRDIIDGEIAALHGRFDDASTAFERARAVASTSRVTWLEGFASERIARFARLRGQTLLAKAAFDAARGAYEAWGAVAVVRRLEREQARQGTDYNRQ